ncbi:hypothetical protein SAMN05216431_11520 [Ligilactobacillus sp. WC1T17]|uniref:Streptomycin biosynthesis protein StrF domain-containing protein n=1 Tax=Ligilactobacillus ruminis TaxID=1623 RepID=A0ABY1ADV2_9LACO|nr:hypothetical protein SAMN05216431_11520 [Ligilactobacillus ruminis]
MLLSFLNDPQLGLLGVVGTDKLTPNLVWWQGHMIGESFDNSQGQNKIFNFEHDLKHTMPAMVVDGFLMCTQYDLPWREDVFDGWHFYDASQCFEFQKQGYKVGIMSANKPVAFHDCGVVNLDGYKKYRDLFYREYFQA